MANEFIRLMIRCNTKEGVFRLKDLAKEYRRSAVLLKNRIGKLTDSRDFLVKRTKDPDEDPDIIELSGRLKPLKNMLADLQEVTREVNHYYDRWWWRSEKYTLNARKSRKFKFSRPVYDKAGDEPAREAENEGLPQYCDRIITYRQAKAGCGDVLHRREENEGEAEILGINKSSVHKLLKRATSKLVKSKNYF
jgi:hypothetical protein